LETLDVSPASENKSVPVGLAAVAAMENPRCALVAQASFWRLDGGFSWWSAATLASVSICATVEAIDPIHRSPFSHFPIHFTVLVLA
jgi:hypothetical protein